MKYFVGSSILPLMIALELILISFDLDLTRPTRRCRKRWTNWWRGLRNKIVQGLKMHTKPHRPKSPPPLQRVLPSLLWHHLLIQFLQRARLGRLRRLCEIKPSGRCNVPDNVHKMWKHGSKQDREAMMDELESAGWSKDGCWHNVPGIYPTKSQIVIVIFNHLLVSSYCTFSTSRVATCSNHWGWKPPVPGAVRQPDDQDPFQDE